MNKNFIKAFELKKNRKYLFVFDLEKSGVDMENLYDLSNTLHDKGFDGIALVIRDINGLKIVEQKNEMSKLSSRKSRTK